MAIDQTTASSPMSSDEGSHRHGPIGVILDVAVRESLLHGDGIFGDE